MIKKEVTMKGVHVLHPYLCCSHDVVKGLPTLMEMQLCSTFSCLRITLGGIDFSAVTQLYNPSPFTMDLGTAVFSMAYKNVTIGIDTGTNTKLGPGSNTVTLEGTLQPHTSDNGSLGCF